MKMKTGLSTSISRLVNGEQRRSFCFANGFSRSLESILFNGRYRCLLRCQCQGLQSSRTFSSCSEDAFEELGPPSEGLSTQFKLRTQKPELHVRNGPKKEFNRSSSPLGSRQSISSIYPKFVKPSKTARPILQDRESVFGQVGDMKNNSKVDSCSVTAEDVNDGVDNCATDSKIVTIRIQDIAKETTYHNIHSICKSVGVLEGLAKTEDAVDVFFRVNNDTDSQHILKRLNGTVIDESHWSAFELPEKNSTPSSSSSSSSTIEDDRYKTGVQISNALFDLKQQINYKKICCEDLELLHKSVMHLKDLPTIINPSYKN